MGPATDDDEVLKDLMRSGMDIARLNFSHGDHEEQLGRIKRIKKFREELNLPIAILLDTKGPEIRTGLLETDDDVELVTAKTATDFQGNPAIIVTYNFTNNSNANASFLTSVSANAFQNSVQCNVATMMPDVMDAQPSLAEVQPGGTITLECAYSLQDTTNPITVQVGPLMSITNEVNAQMTFSFKNN